MAAGVGTDLGYERTRDSCLWAGVPHAPCGLDQLECRVGWAPIVLCPQALQSSDLLVLVGEGVYMRQSPLSQSPEYRLLAGWVGNLVAGSWVSGT